MGRDRAVAGTARATADRADAHLGRRRWTQGTSCAPGDLLGALTGDAGLPGDAIGKISISDFQALVAIRREQAKQALQRLSDGKIKGRRFKVRLI